MRITNKTKNRVLANAEVASSIWSKTRGLMFRKSLPRGSGLLMDFKGEARPGIWMLFMRFPIDLVFIDKKTRVVDIKENIRPLTFSPRTWRVYYPKRPARYVLEIPAGTVKRTGTGIGHRLSPDIFIKQKLKK